MCPGTDSVHLRRRRLLVEAGEATAAVLSADVAQRFNINDAIAFNRDSKLLDKAIDGYFSKVALFKTEHDFSDGDRINFSKIAGLLALVVLDLGAPRFFQFDKRLSGKVYREMVGSFFVYRLIGIVLMLDLSAVDEDVENDLIRCLTLHPNIRADAEWLFWSMRVLQVAYGSPALGAP